MKSYERLIDLHDGQNAFILGSGTSLFKITKHKRYKEIFDHVSVAINSSIIATDWLQGDIFNRYWTSNDVCAMLWTYWAQVLDSKCSKVIRDSWHKQHDALEPYMDDFYEFSPRTGWDGAPQNINELLYGEGCKEPDTDEEHDNAIKVDEKALCSISSIPSAIDLAIQMGCKKIFLLGVDHYMAGGKSHFWDYLPQRERPRVSVGGYRATHRMQKAMFEENMKTYNSLNKFAEKKGAKIFMCNHNSRVKAFDKIEFDDALEMVK